jgi:predicted PurR-regulated permease PerM
VLISTLGGIAVFGANGFVIGPVIAALFVAAWEIFTASRAATVAPPEPSIPPPSVALNDPSVTLNEVKGAP